MKSETLKAYILKVLKAALKKQGFDEIDPEIAIPDLEFGDYSTNAVLSFAKLSKQNPKELAKKIAEDIKVFDTEAKIETSEPAGPGFINFRLSPSSLTGILEEIIRQKENFGKSESGKMEKVLVEYFQPNIAKPLHLGHLGTAIIGDSLFRILTSQGYRVESDTHIGDWGTQFGLLIYAFKQYGDIKIIEKDPINELNKLYVKINVEVEKDPSLREKGKAEFVKLEKGDKENRKIWEQFSAWSWQEFEFIYNQLGIRKADHNWPESFYEDKMPAVITELKSKGLLKESQGAQIVDLAEFNFGVAVIVKSDGGTTYLLRDLATYIYRKNQGFAHQLYVVDVRQSHTLAQTFKILELLGHIKDPSEAVHVAYGFLTLPEGAMSTRKGTSVDAKVFLRGVEAAALEIIEEKNPELSGKENVAKSVAAAAIKYFNLSRNIKSDIVFDPKKAISFEGNTGPYLQYTHARIHGILRKATGNRKQATDSKALSLLPNELILLRKLIHYPEIIEQAAKDMQPNVICNYLFELSQTFNSFYQEIPVLQEKDEKIKSFRLNLITATAQVIKNGLRLLGIEAPEEM